MLFSSTERCVLQRPSLLQLNAAITRLEDEGWQRAPGGPALSSHNPRMDPYWWITMHRTVPMFSGQGPWARLWSGNARNVSHRGMPALTTYTPAAGLLR